MTYPGFEIPNVTTPGLPTPVLAMPDEEDIDILAGGFQAYGVQYGCEVTSLGIMDVDIAAGVVLIDGEGITVPPQTPTVSAGGLLARLDLVSVDSTGFATITAGALSAGIQEIPALPAGHVALAILYVPALEATSIDPDEIVDKRVILKAAVPSHPMASPGLVGFHPGPGWTWTGLPVAGAHLVDRIYYEPLRVERPITVTDLAIEVLVPSAPATSVRLGIYRAGLTWQSASAGLMLDAGPVPSDVPGFLAVPVAPTILPPGNYLKAFWVEDPVELSTLGDSFILGNAPGSLVTPIEQTYTAPVAFGGPFTATGLIWTVAAPGLGGHRHAVQMRWTAS